MRYGLNNSRVNDSFDEDEGDDIIISDVDEDDHYDELDPTSNDYKLKTQDTISKYFNEQDGDDNHQSLRIDGSNLVTNLQP